MIGIIASFGRSARSFTLLGLLGMERCVVPLDAEAQVPVPVPLLTRSGTGSPAPSEREGCSAGLYASVRERASADELPTQN